MEDEESSAGFEYLGRYHITEAKRLFDALEKAEIDFVQYLVKSLSVD